MRPDQKIRLYNTLNIKLGEVFNVNSVLQSVADMRVSVRVLSII